MISCIWPTWMVSVSEHNADHNRYNADSCSRQKTTTGLVQNSTREYFLTSGTKKHESLRYLLSTVVKRHKRLRGNDECRVTANLTQEKVVLFRQSIDDWSPVGLAFLKIQKDVSLSRYALQVPRIGILRLNFVKF